MKKVSCPVDGCNYSGPRSSVVGHYSGKQDDDHSGGYYHAQEVVPGDPPEDFDGNQSQTMSDDPKDDDSTEDNPAFDGPDADPPDGQVCTDCGNQLLEPGDEFSYSGSQMRVDEGEYVCVNCGLIYNEDEL